VARLFTEGIIFFVGDRPHGHTPIEGRQGRGPALGGGSPRARGLPFGELGHDAADPVSRSHAADPGTDGVRVTIVNREPTPRSIVIRPRDRKGSWIDVMTNRPLESSADGSLRIAVPATGVVMSELRDER
jgi:hypothetical protein